MHAGNGGNVSNGGNGGHRRMLLCGGFNGANGRPGAPGMPGANSHGNGQGYGTFGLHSWSVRAFHSEPRVQRACWLLLYYQAMYVGRQHDYMYSLSVSQLDEQADDLACLLTLKAQRIWMSHSVSQLTAVIYVRLQTT